jgi:hypothetical protein
LRCWPTGTRASLLPIENKAVPSLPYGGVVGGEMKVKVAWLSEAESKKINGISGVFDALSVLIASVLFLLLACWFFKSETVGVIASITKARLIV